MHLVPEDLGPQELVKRKERIHSRVQNIEYEVHAFCPYGIPFMPITAVLDLQRQVT